MCGRWMAAVLVCALVAGCSRPKPNPPIEDPVSTQLPDRAPSHDRPLDERYALALRRNKTLTLEDFSSRDRNGADPYLDRISFDPTQARFFPEVHTKLRLDSAQLSAFRKLGFVVQPRVSHSFADAYYLVYTNDLPVFVTTDSVLHAWHHSFDTLLMELETQRLAAALNALLVGMVAQLPEVHMEASGTAVESAVADVDVYLAVALSLLRGTTVPPQLVPGRVHEVETVAESVRAGLPGHLTLFSQTRPIDFSIFKPRGHYRSLSLARYFQAMMWCGHIDMRIADSREKHSDSSTAELAAAVVMSRLLQRAELMSSWHRLDDTISAFVGPTDSATPMAMAALLGQAGIRSLQDLPTQLALEALQRVILATRTGTQQISAHMTVADPDVSGPLPLPRSFTLLGQKFVLDAWSMSRLVHDQTPIQRRVPSGLDVAYSVFGNDAAIPFLAKRMKPGADGIEFRDGVPIQANLVSLREAVDEFSPDVWSNNLYMGWLAALRSLSEPSTAGRYPQAMRTRAWAGKTLNTQLASWTELRHDTTLYVKQSSGRLGCEYPAGFVEPRVAFWKQMELLARQAATLAVDVSIRGQRKPSEFFAHFAEVSSVLRAISERELAGLPLDASQKQFLEEVVDMKSGYGGMRTYRGWYPSLFLGGAVHSDVWDALVADVHMDPPDPVTGDPGSVLYEAVGDVDLMVVAVNSGDQKAVYAGPLMSWYEFTRPFGHRLTDNDWQDWVRSCRELSEACKPLPKRSEFTSEYMVSMDAEPLQKLKPGRPMQPSEGDAFGSPVYHLPGAQH